MASENWQERLEAYLDGELDAEAVADFEAETAASPALQAELAARRRFGAMTRGILRGEATQAPVSAVRPARGTTRRRAGITAAAALAAVLCLLLLAPPLMRRAASAPEIRAGQVVAIRFGEIPGATVTLKTGCFDHETDNAR